jgi:hypothetical protein
MKENNTRISIPIFSAISAILVAVVFYFAFFTPTPVNADSVIVYDFNESGLSYGSAVEASLPEFEPDLISAYATNGSIGYVYKSDLEKAQSPYSPKNPEEAILLMENRFMAASLSFIYSVESQTGLKPSAEVSVVNASLTTIFEAYGGEAPFESLTETERSIIINLLPQGVNTTEIASTAYNAACAANDQSIPVYASDGRTIIGEFVVS